jgi:hypothetical protein
MDFVYSVNPKLRTEGWAPRLPSAPAAPEPVFNESTAALRAKITKLARSRNLADLELAAAMAETVFTREQEAGRDFKRDLKRFFDLRDRAIQGATRKQSAIQS